jgi:hypothetical protein
MPLYPRKKDPGPQSRSGHCRADKKICCICRESNPGHPDRSPSIYRMRHLDACTYYGIQRAVMWDLWWTRWHWDRISPSTSIFPANSHSTDCSTLIIWGWYHRANSGCRTNWTQSHYYGILICSSMNRTQKTVDCTQVRSLEALVV